MNDSILPEFEAFVDAGSAYREKATTLRPAWETFYREDGGLKEDDGRDHDSINTIAHAIGEGEGRFMRCRQHAGARGRHGGHPPYGREPAYRGRFEARDRGLQKL